MKRSVFLALVVAVLFITWVPWVSGADPEFKIRFGHVAPPPHPQNKAALFFKAFVEKKSEGRIQVSVHPLGQLGGEIGQTEAVGLGTQEMASITSEALVNFVPQMGLFALPFFYQNFQEIERVWSSDVGYEIMKSFTKRGMYCLGWSTNGFRDWANSKRLIHSPEDMAGMKLRCTEAPVYIDAYKALGVNPITMPWPEVFSATQQGVIDGLDLPVIALEMIKFYETTKYLTISNGWPNSGIMTIVNKAFFDRLPPDLQRIVRDGAYESARINLAYTMEGTLSAIDKWKEKGGLVHVITQKELAPFREKMTPLHENWRKTIGPELYDRAVKIIEETRNSK
jgi:tripartite ATP-independent transporter DctP family solute receptor